MLPEAIFEICAGDRAADQVGGLFGDAQAEQRFGLVLADQVLRQHQVGQVGFADFGGQLFVGHVQFLHVGGPREAMDLILSIAQET